MNGVSHPSKCEDLTQSKRTIGTAQEFSCRLYRLLLGCDLVLSANHNSPNVDYEDEWTLLGKEKFGCSGQVWRRQPRSERHRSYFLSTVPSCFWATGISTVSSTYSYQLTATSSTSKSTKPHRSFPVVDWAVCGNNWKLRIGWKDGCPSIALRWAIPVLPLWFLKFTVLHSIISQESSHK